MAISLAAAAIGSAVIGGAASAIGAGKNASAINKATDATVQTNAQNLALQKEIYGENKQTLAPYVNTGVQATGAINALLGLTPTNQPIQQAAPQAAPNMPNYSGSIGNIGNIADYVRGKMGIGGGWQMSAAQQPQQQAAPASYLTPQQAFQNYQNSTGYQFRVNQGMNALNSGYAGIGAIKSGAAIKGAQDYGQNIASQEFNNYMNLLSGQQGVGATAAGAQAGVATNYANTAGAINSNTANALGQAAIAKANNSNALLGSLAGSAGSILGGLRL